MQTIENVRYICVFRTSVFFHPSYRCRVALRTRPPRSLQPLVPGRWAGPEPVTCQSSDHVQFVSPPAPLKVEFPKSAAEGPSNCLEFKILPELLQFRVIPENVRKVPYWTSTSTAEREYFLSYLQYSTRDVLKYLIISFQLNSLQVGLKHLCHSSYVIMVLLPFTIYLLYPIHQ